MGTCGICHIVNIMLAHYTTFRIISKYNPSGSKINLSGNLNSKSRSSSRNNVFQKHGTEFLEHVFPTE